MPGTPATTPRHAIPRIASTDTDDVPRDINAAVDRIDVTAPIFGSGLLASRPSAGAGIADRYYYATDAVRLDGSTGVLYRDAGGGAPTWSAVTPVAPGPMLVTSLPGSPVDGQECYYQADATNGIIWHLRYRSASSSAYKWECVGGSPLGVEVVTGESSASTTYTSAGFTAMTVSLPLAGDYDVHHGTDVSVINNTGVMGYDIGATAAVDADAVVVGLAGAGAASINVSGARTRRKTVTGAVVLTAKYKTGGASTTFLNRFLRAMPVRVG
jgi:hypothetical protein